MNTHNFKVSSDCGGCSCGCVGVAIEDDGVYVTNTSIANSPITKFTHQEWAAFVAGAKNGEFDLR